MTEQASMQAAKDKQALFDLMLKKKGIVAPQETTIPQSANGGAVPLSDPQKRIWSLYRLDPTSPAYHMRLARQMIGPLDKDILALALETIANRHHILRAAYPELEGHPKQLIVSDFKFPLTTLDLQDHPAEKLQEMTAELMLNFVKKPFDLEKGPLVRALLIQQAPERHVLLLIFHQIIFDGASGGLFMREMTSLYEALVAGKEPDLPELSIQYADYTLWRRKQLRSEYLAPQRDYWRNQLSNRYHPLSLPTDKPRSSRETFSGSSMHFSLPPELGRALKQFSQREGVTLFAALLAGFNVLLSNYGRQEDVLVFTSAEGRVHPQLKPLIGIFSRQLPLRIDLSGRPTFRTLVSRVNQVIKAAFANQDISFSELVEMIRLAPGHSPAALFQAMFIFLSEPRPDLELSGLQLEPIPVNNQMAKFDWRLQMVDQEDELSGWLEYKSDLFTEATIGRVIANFQQLLSAAVRNPDQSLDILHSLVEAEPGRYESIKPQGPVQQTYVAPRDRIELELNQLWEEAFSLSPIGIHDDFFELGGHSLLAIRLFALVEEKTGRKLPLTTLFKAPTIAKMAELIQDESRENEHSTLIPIKPDGARIPYFFVPPAGTTVLKYAGLAALVDQDQPLYGLQPVGLELGETPHLTVEEMAAYYLQAIQTVQPNGPYILGGQCFGGLVAFEMARQLKQKGQEVAILAIIDTELPPLKPSSEYINGHNGSFNLASAARDILSIPWNAYVFFRKTYKRTLATRMWAHKNPVYLWQNMSIWRRYSRTLQAHLDARLHYEVSDPYPGTISLLEFSSSNHQQKEGRWRWSDLALSGFDVEVIDDNEESRKSGGFTQQLGQWLRKHLDEAQNKLPSPEQ